MKYYSIWPVYIHLNGVITLVTHLFWATYKKAPPELDPFNEWIGSGAHQVGTLRRKFLFGLKLRSIGFANFPKSTAESFSIDQEKCQVSSEKTWQQMDTTQLLGD